MSRTPSRASWRASASPPVICMAVSLSAVVRARECSACRALSPAAGGCRPEPLAGRRRRAPSAAWRQGRARSGRPPRRASSPAPGGRRVALSSPAPGRRRYSLRTGSRSGSPRSTSSRLASPKGWCCCSRSHSRPPPSPPAERIAPEQDPAWICTARRLWGSSPCNMTITIHWSRPFSWMTTCPLPALPSERVSGTYQPGARRALARYRAGHGCHERETKEAAAESPAHVGCPLPRTSSGSPARAARRALPVAVGAPRSVTPHRRFHIGWRAPGRMVWRGRDDAPIFACGPSRWRPSA